MIITGQSIDWTSVYDVILVNTTTAVLISILLTLPIYFIIPKNPKAEFF